LRRQRI